MRSDSGRAVGPVLILAPTGRDAEGVGLLLRRESLAYQACADVAELFERIGDAGADRVGAVLVAEEALGRTDLAPFSRQLETQPPWSDLPFVVLTSGTPGRSRAAPERRLAEALGNVMFLERPLAGVTLVTALRAALRARRRQLQIRDHLQEREAAAKALRASEERLRASQQAARIAFWTWEVSTGEIEWSTAFTDLFGLDGVQPSLGYGAWLDLLHPADRERAERESLATTLAGEGEIEYRILRRGQERWIRTTGKVVAWDGQGRALRMTGVASDITERRRAEERQRLLLHELNHRVKNTLASVQSIAAQTLRTAATPEAFREAFEARLLALSHTHDLLTAGSWEGATLEEILRGELAPYNDGRGGPSARCSLRGGHVRLTPKTAVALGMAVHELATNAAKYGALSLPGGRVEVSWEVAMDGVGPELRVSWIEAGGPPVAPPRRQGFGVRLIERGLARELDGEVRLDFAATGVRCAMTLPLGSGRAG